MQKNFLLAFVLSFAVIFGWNSLIQKSPNTNAQATNSAEIKTDQEKTLSQKHEEKTDERDEKIDQSLILPIKTKFLNGAISLKGLKINSIKLLDYKTELNSTQNIELLTDQDKQYPYFISFGFNSKNTAQNDLVLPNSQTVWQADGKELTQDTPLTLKWTNKQGVTFGVKLSIKDDYLIESELSVLNTTDNVFEISMYTLINKSYSGKDLVTSAILHEGLTSVFDGKLDEYSYSSIKDKREQAFAENKIDWIGVTDKYFLVAIVPSKDKLYTSGIQYDFIDQKDKVQVDVSTKRLKLESSQTIKTKYSLFLGPKKFKILDSYEKKYDIKLFDRAIDFGWLYIITKPIFLFLSFINSYVANFGISILILTLIIKLLMLKVTNSAYKSMQKMKEVQPQIEQLKVKYELDKLKLNREILELYKVNKINPFTGILSIFLQIPIFFGIYKVLYVTIEMRHAHFIGWIQDLSAADPSNIFNLFGLIDVNLPSFLHLGAWPILMSFSMYIQQLFSPVQDPVQAKVMKFLPLIFLFTFNSFPAGLLVYWTFSNLISIAQQLLMKRK